MLPHQLLIGIQGLVGRVGVVRGKAAAQLLVHQAVLHAPLRRLGGVRVCNVLEGRGFGRLRTACGVPQQQGSLGTVLRHGHALRQQGFQLLLGNIAVHAVTHQTGHGCAAHQQDGRAAATAVVATGGDTGALGHGAGRDIFIGHRKGCGPLVLARQGVGNRPIGGDLPPAKFLVLRELGGVCRQGHRIAGLHVQHSTGAAVHRCNTVGHCQLILARLRGNRGAATSGAAAVFLRWLTEQQRNLEFAADTGYMPVFQNDMERYFDQLAAMGVNLSEDMGALVDQQLASREMTFDQLNDSPEVLNALEEEMIEPLCRSLRRTSCSGAFVLLDATVNTRMEGAGYSRAGLYVQKGGADTPTVPLLLYRGSADVGKTHSVMPHRKWRMEFQTDQFPDYDRWMTPSSTPLYQAYTLTERFSLPGTSEEVQLFLLPLRGRDGTMYGLCGFEISQSFFKQNFAQPTGFDHLICLLAPADSGLNASAALSSGTTGGYFHAPRDMLVLRSMGSSLTQLIGSDSAYAGISELCRLSENQSYRLAVCIPMTDYRRLIFSGNLQMLLIGLFILFFVVFCCMYFHQHILSPAFRQFEEDRRESRRRMDELQMERQQMQTELSRLADVCRNESVPDAFQTFLEGIPNLTKTERRIFDGYVAGLRSREIVEQLDIKDSTLRFHNKNIYEKLGVSSLKQLQQFAAILNSGGNSAPDSAPDESGPKKAR